MPDLIRHPVYSWIPAFAGMTIGRYLIAGLILSRFGIRSERPAPHKPATVHGTANLPAFGKAAEMTSHAAFFKADGLATVGTGFS